MSCTSEMPNADPLARDLSRGTHPALHQTARMTVRKVLPSTLQGVAFSIGSALELGVGESRLRGIDLETPYWGVRTPRGYTSMLVGRARAFLARGPETAILSHISAAQLWGIPLPGRLARDERLHVTVPPDVRAPRGHGVAGHHVHLHPLDVARYQGVRVTSQARTLCDLASIVDGEDLLAAADYLRWWRREDHLRVDRDEVQQSIDRHPTSRGVARLRAIAPMSTDRADSAPESIIRYRILHAGFPPPEVNPEVFDDRSNFLAMPDLAYVALKVALDYEGDHHRVERDQWERDIRRVPRLQDAGWHHTRISRADLRDSSDFLTRLGRTLRARGMRSSSR
jgi:hypothetical protein